MASGPLTQKIAAVGDAPLVEIARGQAAGRLDGLCRIALHEHGLAREEA